MADNDPITPAKPKNYILTFMPAGMLKSARLHLNLATKTQNNILILQQQHASLKTTDTIEKAEN